MTAPAERIVGPDDRDLSPSADSRQVGPALSLTRVSPQRRSVARNASFLMGSQAVGWALGTLMSVVVPRHLGPSALGELRLGVSLWTVGGAVAAFGTHTLLTKEFSRDPDGAREVLARTITLQLLIYAACWVAIAGFATLVGYGPSTFAVIAIVGASVLFEPFSRSARSALYGLERMEFVAVTDGIAKLLHVGVVLTFVVLGFGVNAIAAGTIVQASMAAFLLVVFLRRLGVSYRLRAQGIGSVARRSSPYMVLHVTLLAYQQIDVIVISLIVSQETLGWYGTAAGLFASLLFVPTILMTSLFPVLSRLHVQRAEDARRVLQRGVNTLLAAAVPIGLGTVAIAAPLSVTLFGDEFAGTGPVLAVFGVVVILTYLTILLGRFAVAIDRQRFWMVSMLSALVATVGLDIILVPWTAATYDNGAIGGALAYLVTELGLLTMGVAKLAPWLINRSTLTRAAKCLLAGGAMMAAVWPFRWNFLAVPVLIGAAVYILSVLALRVLDGEEKTMLRTTATRVLRRVSRRSTARKDRRP